MESERPIEKLLRACALKRRQEAELPSEPHPATRRLLQGEVARQFGRAQAQETPTRKWWSVLVGWPRLAWAGAGVAVVLFAGLALLISQGGGRKGELLARNDQPAAAHSLLAPEPSRARTDQAAPATTATELEKQPQLAILADSKMPVPAEVVQQAEPAKDKALVLDQIKRERNLGLAANEPTALTAQPNGTLAGVVATGGEVRSSGTALNARLPAAPLPAAAPSVARAPALAQDREQSLASDDLRLALAKAAPPAQTAPGSALFFRDEARVAGTPVREQEFVRTSARALAKNLEGSAPENSVLVSFKVQPAGNDLSIVDADGSVYSGYLQPAPQPTAAAIPPLGSAKPINRRLSSRGAADGAPAQPASAYTFHVVGTNRTLNQKVEFSGNFWPQTNVLAFGDASSTAAFAGGLGGGIVTNAPSLWLLNSRILGKAVINGRQQVEVNAAPKP